MIVLIVSEIKNNLLRDKNVLYWNILMPLLVLLLLGITFGDSYLRSFSSGIISANLMFSFMFGLSLVLAWEREKKILRRLRLTPLGLGKLLLIKTVPQILIALIQIIILLLTLTLIWKIKVYLSGYLLLFFGLTCLAFIPLSILIGNLGKNVQSVSNIANAITLPMIYLSETFFSLKEAHPWIQMLSRAMPLRYLVEGFNKALFCSAPVTVEEILVPLVFGILCLLIALRIFRWEAWT